VKVLPVRFKYTVVRTSDQICKHEG